MLHLINNRDLSVHLKDHGFDPMHQSRDSNAPSDAILIGNNGGQGVKILQGETTRLRLKLAPPASPFFFRACAFFMLIPHRDGTIGGP